MNKKFNRNKLKATYEPGEKVSVMYGDNARNMKPKAASIIKDYGRFVLVRMLHHNECFFKEDLMEGIK